MPRLRIIIGELLPNMLGPMMVEASLRLTYSIGVIAALAFLGLAPDPNSPNWGTMIQQNQLVAGRRSRGARCADHRDRVADHGHRLDRRRHRQDRGGHRPEPGGRMSAPKPAPRPRPVQAAVTVDDLQIDVAATGRR